MIVSVSDPDSWSVRAAKHLAYLEAPQISPHHHLPVVLVKVELGV